MLLKLMLKIEYLILPKGTKFTGLGKLGLKKQKQKKKKTKNKNKITKQNKTKQKKKQNKKTNNKKKKKKKTKTKNNLEIIWELNKLQLKLLHNIWYISGLIHGYYCDQNKYLYWLLRVLLITHDLITHEA